MTSQWQHTFWGLNLTQPCTGIPYLFLLQFQLLLQCLSRVGIHTQLTISCQIPAIQNKTPCQLVRGHISRFPVIYLPQNSAKYICKCIPVSWWHIINKYPQNKRFLARMDQAPAGRPCLIMQTKTLFAGSLWQQTGTQWLKYTNTIKNVVNILQNTIYNHYTSFLTKNVVDPVSNIRLISTAASQPIKSLHGQSWRHRNYKKARDADDRGQSPRSTLSITSRTQCVPEFPVLACKTQTSIRLQVHSIGTANRETR